MAASSLTTNWATERYTIMRGSTHPHTADSKRCPGHRPMRTGDSQMESFVIYNPKNRVRSRWRPCLMEAAHFLHISSTIGPGAHEGRPSTFVALSCP